MDRRGFIRTTGLTAGAFALDGTSLQANLISSDTDTWFNRPMRWAQLTLVENDPGSFDPDFWLSYFKRIHADAACLSAGGGGCLLSDRCGDASPKCMDGKF